MAVAEIFDALREIMNAFAFQLANAGDVEAFRLERPDPRADDDGATPAIALGRAESNEAIG
jgi:hypothetical protein